MKSDQPPMHTDTHR